MVSDRAVLAGQLAPGGQKAVARPPRDRSGWQSVEPGAAAAVLVGGRLRSAVNTREHCSVLYLKIGFKNSGLMLEFRFLVGIGRSGVMIGRLCLNMVS